MHITGTDWILISDSEPNMQFKKLKSNYQKVP